MSPSKALFFLSLSFIFGIAVESLVKIPQIGVPFGSWGFLFTGILIILFSLYLNKETVDINHAIADFMIIAGFCLLLFCLGILRVQISEFNIANDELSRLNGKGQVVLTGIILDEPDVRDVSQMISVKVGLPAQAGGSTILVTAKRYPEYKYLDKIKLAGKLEEPGVTDSFNYKNYLMKDGIYSVMGFPKIEVLSHLAPRSLGEVGYEKILLVKQKMRQSIQANFLPPQSSILEGTILGDNSAMTPDLKSKLNITGLRHIIAVSGTHVVILSSIVMSLLLAAGFWRGQAFYIAIAFICIYIVLTGLPASGIRAGIMGGLYLWAQKLGRQSMGIRVIVSAGAGMLMFNPLLLIYDVGFQLSFLAVVGIIYLEPFFKNILLRVMQSCRKKLLLHEIDGRPFYEEGVKAENLLGIVSTTFAAQIFTLPIMVYNFGNISFVSPITNLLILPIVYWLMVFGFLTSIAGIFSNVLGWILSIPCWLLLTYFVKVIDFFSQSWAMKTMQNIHLVWLVISYVIIIFVTGFLNKRYSQKFG